ncbi:TetR/AcrR family transcriptional regulator [Nocardioides sp.]|uniref:TetR/AcrR family transcriptional regulator n=1 Tax=Nocardioides sp. TaxID=35761 RepID=UPI002C8F41C9|nr:TetR/AcrR family transcriptional regulator [Nocardioides sp.]HSX69251.1 TetR/AcrR family transcriptional regulator [Nocardioides sp.]
MADRREELLELLTDHVQQHGLEGASIRTLATAAGVAHNTLTHHFGSRTELLAAVFERLSSRIPTGPAPTVDTAPTERLRATWAALLTHPQVSTWPVFYEVLSVALRSPEEHRTYLTRVSEGWTAPLAAELVAAGRSQRDALASATFVVAAVRGLVIDALCGGDRERIEDALALLADFVDDLTR